MAAKADCYDLGFSFLCGVVDIGTGVCSLLQVDENFCTNFASFIVDTLEFFKDFILKIVSGFIRMRISIQFSVHTTSEVLDLSFIEIVHSRSFLLQGGARVLENMG